MTFLQVPHSELARLLRPVAARSGAAGSGADQGDVRAADVGSGPDDREVLEDRFATAVFSTLTEPGDTDAGALVGALGAARALVGLVERWPPERLAAEVAEADPGAAAVLAPRIADAIDRWTPRLSLAGATRSLESAARVGAVLLTRSHELWPAGFGALGDGAPLALWVRGDAGAMRTLGRSLALVGARAATGYGEHVAMEAAAGLSDRGITVVSGGAYGIDGAAHRAALASDHPTVAFLAGGVDRLYPAGHTDLLTRIAQRGLLVAELPCGSSPTKWRFLLRNRLIAAASAATVVVEAGRRSGSLNTAGHAAAIGRPLGAVPGPVTSPASAGCHRLLREFDAACVTDAAEMAELAGFDDPVSPGSSRGEAARRVALDGVAVDGHPVRVLDALVRTRGRPAHVVASSSGLSVRDVTATLAELELEGRVAEHADGWVKV
ncbi:DNA-processing protein DprA [Leifsonia poae]|uniref:DNA-processing protein DprA n=1 Tax=Leifsonia poae TaxID=110933 RepID=UPI0022F28594|nr:DNA-processing protein DprA [Leifsonia poae]